MTFEERVVAGGRPTCGFTRAPGPLPGDRDAALRASAWSASTCAFGGMVVRARRPRTSSRAWSPNGLPRPTPARTGGRASITSTTSALYQAIGEPDSRLRSRVPLGARHRAADAARCRARATRVAWLATEREKVAHFTERSARRSGGSELPHLAFGERARQHASGTSPTSCRLASTATGRTPRVRVPGHARRPVGLPGLPPSACRAAPRAAVVATPPARPAASGAAQLRLRGRLPAGARDARCGRPSR